MCVQEGLDSPVGALLVASSHSFVQTAADKLVVGDCSALGLKLGMHRDDVELLVRGVQELGEVEHTQTETQIEEQQMRIGHAQFGPFGEASEPRLGLCVCGLIVQWRGQNCRFDHYSERNNGGVLLAQVDESTLGAGGHLVVEEGVGPLELDVAHEREEAVSGVADKRAPVRSMRERVAAVP